MGASAFFVSFCRKTSMPIRFFVLGAEYFGFLGKGGGGGSDNFGPHLTPISVRPIIRIFFRIFRVFQESPRQIKPNQTADSQAGSRIWGVFVNSECFPGRTRRIHKNPPNSRIGLSLVWFAGATPEFCCPNFPHFRAADP